MGFASVLLIAFGLAADCFAVSLSGSVAMKSINWRQVARVSIAFGLFQGLMPVIGWFAGRAVVDFIAAYDHWLAFGLLAFVGGKMLWEAFRSGEESGSKGDISRGVLLLTLAVATSIDALAVGLSFAFVQVDIVTASLTIGIVACLVSVAGMLIGQKVGGYLGKWAEIVGGIVLIGIGLNIVLEHTLGW
jgi:manganese efflux pump family protein